ncbi:hypothetical protein [Moorena sp. SIO3H5]|uniref:hypothetical protein n=1 Tax=Moorena sp. SIO3H5 TaxID=2607834 RepID=UPI0013B7103B|nr:hypothetical protein [Moorena sp. SIO3H5]NEO72344.1 hypothetical protein [Moorena sp. SIO3H5]
MLRQRRLARRALASDQLCCAKGDRIRKFLLLLPLRPATPDQQNSLNGYYQW